MQSGLRWNRTFILIDSRMGDKCWPGIANWDRIRWYSHFLTMMETWLNVNSLLSGRLRGRDRERKEEGIEERMRNGSIRMLTQILEKRFRTTLAAQVKERMAQWSDDQVQAVLDKLFATESLLELGLDE
jgi:hypothetical protein